MYITGIVIKMFMKGCLLCALFFFWNHAALTLVRKSNSLEKNPNSSEKHPNKPKLTPNCFCSIIAESRFIPSSWRAGKVHFGSWAFVLMLRLSIIFSTSLVHQKLWYLELLWSLESFWLEDNSWSCLQTLQDRFSCSIIFLMSTTFFPRQGSGLGCAWCCGVHLKASAMIF